MALLAVRHLLRLQLIDGGHLLCAEMAESHMHPQMVTTGSWGCIR